MRNLIRRTDRISKAPEQNRQQDSGGSMMRDMITENISRDAVPQGIMNNPIVGTIMEGYDKIEPFIPEKIETTPGISGDFYGYEAPVGPGTLTFGADRGLDNFYGGFQFSFDEGGIVDTPQMQEMMKKELTDEQKDYLYDFMLDFMFKQKQKEQQEMEGNMPRFNYFDMEV
jgi:hypothetical protein